MARKVFKYIILAVIAVNLAIFLWVLFNPATPPRAPLPNPNGYDDFVKAGEKLLPKLGFAVEIPTSYDQFLFGGNIYSRGTIRLADKTEAYRNYVDENAEAIRLIRSGLNKECRVPIEYTTNFFALWTRPRFYFADLASLLLAEGKLAEMEGRTNDAIHSYLEIARFGEEQCRGGFLANSFVGRGCEAKGLKAIRRLLPTLDAGNCRKATEELEEEDMRREPVAEVIARDKILFRRTSGLSLKDKLEEMIKARSLDPNKDQNQAFAAEAKEHQGEARQLTLDLAARAYELEKGKRPKNVADLVPDYLKAVPKDPTTGKDLSLLGR